MIPLFVSQYSIGKSILTLDDPIEINPKYPISIFSIAKTYGLEDIYLCENSFSGFMSAYSGCEKYNFNLRFGYKVTICDNAEQKDADSIKSEHSIIVWLTNSDAYYNAIKIATFAETKGFYYKPRIDYKNLAALWSKNLKLAIPFYDSFIHNNSLKNYNCCFSFPQKPVLFREDNLLPIDILINEKLNEFATTKKLDIVDTKTIRYFGYNESLAYQTFRCIHERTSLQKPNLEGFCSDRFCWEDYLKCKEN